MFQSIVAIAIGASTGAILRWFISLKCHYIFTHIPLGTLLANVIGCYIIGLATFYFSYHSSLSPEWRLLIITGFCGGLTTFSTFSLEVVSLLQNNKTGFAIGTIFLHVGCSIIATYLGFFSYQIFKS